MGSIGAVLAELWLWQWWWLEAVAVARVAVAVEEKRAKLSSEQQATLKK
jgi:hypothetical protein